MCFGAGWLTHETVANSHPPLELLLLLLASAEGRRSRDARKGLGAHEDGSRRESARRSNCGAGWPPVGRLVGGTRSPRQLRGTRHLLVLGCARSSRVGMSAMCLVHGLQVGGRVRFVPHVGQASGMIQGRHLRARTTQNPTRTIFLTTRTATLQHVSHNVKDNVS